MNENQNNENKQSINSNHDLNKKQEFPMQIVGNTVNEGDFINKQILPIQNEVQQLQVVLPQQQKSLNHAQILRLFKMQEEKTQIKVHKKDNKTIPIKRLQQQPKKQLKQNVQPQRNTKIHNKIKYNVLQYRTLFKPSIFDSQLQKYRYECKQKLFQYCCFGIEELKQLNNEQLNQNELQIIQLQIISSHQIHNWKNDMFGYCKKICMDIDLQFLKLLNKNNRNKISKYYKNKWDHLINNIKDQSNQELRRKILNKIFTPQIMSQANDLQFLTTSKREEIIQKQKKYIAQFAVEKDNHVPMVQQEEIIERTKLDQLNLQKKQQLQPNNRIKKFKYIEEGTITMLEQLLGDSHIRKMKRRLEEDLKDSFQQQMIQNLINVFGKV